MGVRGKYECKAGDDSIRTGTGGCFLVIGTAIESDMHERKEWKE